MFLFMQQHRVSMKTLAPVLKAVLRRSERGYAIGRIYGNFGFEAINDIYSFFRMFRTFDEYKPSDYNKPCQSGIQKNIIYISHLEHALNIIYMIQHIFGILPKHIIGNRYTQGKMLYAVQDLVQPYRLAKASQTLEIRQESNARCQAAPSIEKCGAETIRIENLFK